MNRFRTRAAAAAAITILSLAGCGAAPSSSSAGPAPEVIAASGDIASAVERYRSVLGPDHQEINWDKVPDVLAAPAFLPGDQFAARGAMLATPGTGIQVSAAEGSGTAPRFGHLNPAYATTFATFSAQRLFSPVGSNVVDMTYLVPGTTTPATVRGFGAVYTDIDTDHTAFEYFDAAGTSLGSFAVPIADRGLSFLGVAFTEPVVARVRITYGTAALGPADSPAYDVAVMDDFLYGAPQAR